MIDVLMVILHMLVTVLAAAILVFGFAFLIFVGDANARGRAIVSNGFDKLATLVVYLSWFSLMWWFGFSTALVMIACGMTVMLCLVYVASYSTTASRRLTTASIPPDNRPETGH